MATEDRPASNTTAGPTVPAPRQHDSDQEGARPAGARHARAKHAGARLAGTAHGDIAHGDIAHGDIAQGNGGQPEGATEPTPARASADRVLERTRLSGTWVAIGCFVAVLALLLIFIMQNDIHVSINFFGAHSDVHLGVALVLAAVCGALLVLFAGMARILQLRARARKHRRTVRKAASR
jgi:uncharacterized integral membrane protein